MRSCALGWKRLLYFSPPFLFHSSCVDFALLCSLERVCQHVTSSTKWQSLFFHAAACDIILAPLAYDFDLLHVSNFGSSPVPNLPVAAMGRMVGDNLPPDPKVQPENCMRGFCRPRTGKTMFGSSSHEGTQATVPVSGIQAQASLNTVPDGRVQVKATDAPPSQASTCPGD